MACFRNVYKPCSFVRPVPTDQVLALACTTCVARKYTPLCFPLCGMCTTQVCALVFPVVRHVRHASIRPCVSCRAAHMARKYTPVCFLLCRMCGTQVYALAFFVVQHVQHVACKYACALVFPVVRHVWHVSMRPCISCRAARATCSLQVCVHPCVSCCAARVARKYTPLHFLSCGTCNM